VLEAGARRDDGQARDFRDRARGSAGEVVDVVVARVKPFGDDQLRQRLRARGGERRIQHPFQDRRTLRREMRGRFGDGVLRRRAFGDRGVDDLIRVRHLPERAVRQRTPRLQRGLFAHLPAPAGLGLIKEAHEVIGADAAVGWEDRERHRGIVE
jgi:hypothetical protein